MAAKTYLKTTLVTFALTIVLSVFTAVHAQVIYVDADANGLYNGSSWADAHNYLQDALAAAVMGDEIHVAQGIYTPDRGAAVISGDRTAAFQLITGVTVKGGYAGFGEPDPDARDVDLYQTVLSGDLAGDDGPNFANNAENSYQVVVGSGTDATAVLDGFTITAGNANGAGTYGYGSGIYNENGDPTLTNCTVENNWASSGGGGGIYDVNSATTLTNCSFNDNWPDGMDNYNSSPTLTNCTFSGNFRGMQNYNNSSPTLTGCTFSENERGMYNDASSPTLTGCTFTANNGAMSNWAGSSPTLTNCTFTQNSAVTYGGGMYNENANPVLTECIFTDNSADYGGAMYNYFSDTTLTNCMFADNSAQYHSGAIRNFNSNAVLKNCTFNANSADTDGGAIGNSQSSPILTDCTFTSNWAGSHGGAIYNNVGTPVLTDCTFSDNTAFAGAGIDNQDSNAILTGCTFILNSTEEYGAAINNRESSPQITLCIFLRNMANDFGGGAVCNWSSSPRIRNCLFSQNYSSQYGGAVMNNQTILVLLNCTFFQNMAGAGSALGFYSYLNDPPSSIQAANCIFWDGGDEIYKNEETDISITYSDMQGGWPGVGNFDAGPMFVDVTADDYHLLPDSPCIDAGDPNYVPAPNETDLDGQPRVLGGRIDMGVYEQTLPVPIEVEIYPPVINLKSQGKWITTYLTFPEGYNVADVNSGSLRLEGEIEQQWIWFDEESREIRARFPREDVQDVLDVGDIELTVTGFFMNGTAFEGTAIVRVQDRGKK